MTKRFIDGLVTGFLVTMFIVLVFGACKYASDTTYEAKCVVRYTDGVVGVEATGNGFDVDGVMFEFYGDGYKANDRVVVTFDSKGTQTYADDEIIGVTREN